MKVDSLDNSYIFFVTTKLIAHFLQPSIDALIRIFFKCFCLFKRSLLQKSFVLKPKKVRVDYPFMKPNIVFNFNLFYFTELTALNIAR